MDADIVRLEFIKFLDDSIRDFQENKSVVGDRNGFWEEKIKSYQRIKRRFLDIWNETEKKVTLGEEAQV